MPCTSPNMVVLEPFDSMYVRRLDESMSLEKDSPNVAREARANASDWFWFFTGAAWEGYDTSFLGAIKLFWRHSMPACVCRGVGAFSCLFICVLTDV